MTSFTGNFEAGALARIRAEECGDPDPERVTFDGAPAFHYDDGRPACQLPAIDDAGQSRPS